MESSTPAPMPLLPAPMPPLSRRPAIRTNSLSRAVHFRKRHPSRAPPGLYAVRRNAAPGPTAASIRVAGTQTPGYPCPHSLGVAARTCTLAECCCFPSSHCHTSHGKHLALVSQVSSARRSFSKPAPAHNGRRHLFCEAVRRRSWSQASV
jgi:hypothetical protein